ncbi:hypothetical protein VTN77DRAFT_1842 [Rasamsonia byssochlamydoides]|uniref:uncharacterized protein n=1 Tax=Rasamsonia byssochlamydoides TaxID=89139 RepID=UPI003742A55B
MDPGTRSIEALWIKTRVFNSRLFDGPPVFLVSGLMRSQLAGPLALFFPPARLPKAVDGYPPRNPTPPRGHYCVSRVHQQPVPVCCSREMIADVTRFRASTGKLARHRSFARVIPGIKGDNN